MEAQMQEPSEDLAGAWEALAEQVRALSKAAQAAEKALKAVRDPREAPVAATEALAAVGAAAAATLDGTRVQALAAALEEATARWRLTRLTAIKAAAGEAGLAFQQLTADEVRLGEATVALRLDQGTAEVRYAREALATVPADPAAIVAEVRRQLQALASASPAPEALFDELVGAYRAVLARRDLRFGERVELVDLLPELFVVRQPASFWQRPDPKRLRPVTRAQLAWDLDRLQQARTLARNGMRIVLGTATGGSAAKKAQVLFLESGGAGGQFFLTFAVRTESAS
jgi:hypothetical protein